MIIAGLAYYTNCALGSCQGRPRAGPTPSRRRTSCGDASARAREMYTFPINQAPAQHAKSKRACGLAEYQARSHTRGPVQGVHDGLQDCPRVGRLERLRKVASEAPALHILQRVGPLAGLNQVAEQLWLSLRRPLERLSLLARLSFRHARLRLSHARSWRRLSHARRLRRTRRLSYARSRRRLLARLSLRRLLRRLTRRGDGRDSPSRRRAMRRLEADAPSAKPHNIITIL